MAEIEKKWYVLRAISGKEAKVKEYLEADLKNSDLGEYVSQVLIPTEKVYQVRNGKKIVKERSYLPGYVLVEAALVGEVAHHQIEKKWYVLRAISGKEAKVKEYLEADLKNSDLGEYVSQVLIPTEKVYQVRNGKKIVKERSYLPGYVLVEAALVGEVAHHLRNTPNVIGFLGGSEKPVPLRQSEVNRILGTVDELQETGEELNIPYVVGETVKVTFGPFSGFSGIIEEVNSEKKKLKVMVKIFGRKTPLELGFMQVEKE